MPTTSGRVKKPAGKGAFRARVELTPRQLERAQALANITTNYQRADQELIKKMLEKKAASVTPAADASASPSSLPHPLSSSPPASSSSELVSSSSLPPSSPPAASKAPPISQTVPTAPVTTSQYAAIAPSSQTPQTWEDVAQDGIDQRKLSLDRVWSHKSWKQKANNDERLKLLKNDGYDITTLQGKKVSADQITIALLAHVAARSQGNAASVSATPTPVALNPVTPVAVGEDVTATSVVQGHIEPLSQSKRKQVSHEADVNMSGNCQGQTIPMAKREMPERQFHVTSQLAGHKRKHDHEDDDQPDWHESNPQTPLHTAYNEVKAMRIGKTSCTCCMFEKMARMLDPEKIKQETEKQAFDIFKRRPARDIFSASRAARKVPQVQSKVFLQSNTAPVPVFTPKAPCRSSRIVLQAPSAPAQKPSGVDAYISATGIGLILNEFKQLSQSYDHEGNYFIQDPDQTDEEEGNELMKHPDSAEDTFRYFIRLSSTTEDPTIIEGDTRALMGLVKYLREHELTHLNKWYYDEEKMEILRDGWRWDEEEKKWVRLKGVPCHLSDGTQNVLAEIEKMLEAGKHVGGVEVRVGNADSQKNALII
jgi:hypothetical protein